MTGNEIQAGREHPWYDVLHNLEMALLDPEIRGDAELLDELLRDDFVEFGSSGRIYEKKALIRMVVHERPAPVVIRDFEIRALSDDTALVTYRSVGDSGQEARRSSVWVRSGFRWQIVFHQGSRIPNRWGSLA